jgi:hypothetical protein
MTPPSMSDTATMAENGQPLFHAQHTVRLAKLDRPTTVTLEIDVSDAKREAAATVVRPSRDGRRCWTRWSLPRTVDLMRVRG